MNLQNNNNNNKKKGKGYLAPAVILFALLSVISEIGEMERPEALIAVLVGAVILVVILATVGAVKKHSEKSGTPVRSAARPAARTAARPASGGAERAEEAVHCHHSTGKQKYLEQLDGFLANGIIDKAEYRLMKERYSRLNIEDDYH